ncbi:hypothetical protein HDU85_002374 [Gaertneriomyces sp. JEL0708]|nr:hypothetical protein HDU85_002374 [Gaertneriomyces sp. JEL0708]
MVAHSMGGLDCRYMISHLLSAKGEAANFKVNSLTTIATPHHGSSLAPLPFLSTILEPLISTLYSKASLDFRAFTNLTPTYMDTVFNPSTPDVSDVAYFSYGADGTDSVYEKTVMYPFRLTYEILNVLEGVNDGLVSVESAKWGNYMGTVKADHVDLINLFNKWKWDVALKSLDVVEDAAEAIDRSSHVASHVKETAKKVSDDFVASVQRNKGERESREKEHNDEITHKSEKPARHKWESSTFNAIELYLEIADMLAKRGF